jgi:formylglycine-generating enzyme required for sulfatase activity
MMRRTFAYVGAVAVVLLLVGDWMAGGLTQRLVYGSASLSVTSVPSGADVLLDGVEIGTTPLETNVRPGEHVLKLTHRFHPAAVERIELARGDHLVRNVVLQSASGTLTVVSNPIAAHVRIDGALQAGTTPLTIASIVAGTHRIEVFQHRRTTVAVTRDVLPNETTEVNVELEPARIGTLDLKLSPPDARVELVGQDEAFKQGMELPIGEYHLRISRANYGSVERDVTVRIGENLVAVTLTHLVATLTLDVQPTSATVTIVSGAGTQRYQRPLELPTGPISIRARAVGYRNWQRDATLPAGGLKLKVALARINAKPGTTFADPLKVGGTAPKVVVVGAGRFRMGDDDPASTPVHTVTISQPFAIGVFEVTRGEYRTFANTTGATMPQVSHAETDRNPVVDVGWGAAVAYTDWLTKQTGHTYRLPTEAEWEYAARAGATTPYAFGSDPKQLCKYGNVADQTTGKSFIGWDVVDCDDGALRTAPVGRYLPNAFGLYDVEGNAAEWVLDCWHISYENAPSDGRAWLRNGHCTDHVVRGGSWADAADGVRLSDRRPASTPGDSRGFRVVREL